MLLIRHVRGAALLQVERSPDGRTPRRQPPFLNAAVKATTHLPPHELLRQLKVIEAEMGRNFGGQARLAAVVLQCKPVPACPDALRCFDSASGLGLSTWTSSSTAGNASKRPRFKCRTHGCKSGRSC